MSLWTSGVVFLLLLQTVPAQTEPAEVEAAPVANEEVASGFSPHKLIIAGNDWDLKRAYSDAFQILSSKNNCSSFYGGSTVATTVLNSFVARIRSDLLLPEVSFQMDGNRILLRVEASNVSYRLFDKTRVNIRGSFYRRRDDSWRLLPADVGSFRPGTRPARVLLLLHELGHLIQNENGAWLLPDDGHDVGQSRANTLAVEQACRAELAQLR